MLRASRLTQYMTLAGLVMLVGKQGIDWQYYVHEELYWRKWVELNRN